MIDEKEIAQQPRYENVNESREAEADGERPCVELDKSSEAPEADQLCRSQTGETQTSACEDCEGDREVVVFLAQFEDAEHKE